MLQTHSYCFTMHKNMTVVIEHKLYESHLMALKKSAYLIFFFLFFCFVLLLHLMCAYCYRENPGNGIRNLFFLFKKTFHNYLLIYFFYFSFLILVVSGDKTIWSFVIYSIKKNFLVTAWKKLLNRGCLV